MIAISAEILNVTVAEYLVLEATAEARNTCPCVSCLAGEGDKLCVSCHYRYANCGDQCTKCYSYEFECQMQDEAKERIDALGRSMGVENAWEKFQAESEAESAFCC